MAAYDIRQLQLRILDILKAFHKVCQDHNLRYYLWAGTMLGAVRHGGFIPWDDDADVAMPQEDYDLLVAHSEEWLPSPMELTCLEKNPNFTGTFAKLIDSSTTLIERYDYKSIGGIYIDIFPINGVSKNGFCAKNHVRKFSMLRKMAYFCNRNPFKHGRGPSSWIPRIIQSLYTNRQLQEKAIRIMKEYAFSQSDNVCDFDDGPSGIMPKEYLGNGVPIIFEGNTLIGVSMPDKYLAHKYGDYMTIPPGKKQRQHNFFYLDYNLPYKEYIDNRSFMQ